MKTKLQTIARKTSLLLALILCVSGEAKKSPSVTAVIERAVNELLVSTPRDQEVCFSPEGSCDVKLWKFIQSAQKSLDIAVYDLTHPKIAHEILVASKKIPVRLICDRRQSKGQHSLIPMMIRAGLKVRFGKQRGIMHHKFAVVDGVRVQLGSFNYTEGASSKNQENQIYLFNEDLASTYQNQFETMWRGATQRLTARN